MTRRLALCLSLVVGIAAATSVHAEPDDPALAHAVYRGDLIYALDQAAWVSTDAMLAQIPNPRSVGVSGWIVEGTVNPFHVTYYRADPERPTAVFTAEVVNNRVISTHLLGSGEDNRLTPIEVRMIRAREVAGQQKTQLCTSGAKNAVVLPPVTVNEPVSVYVLTSQVKTGEYPAGGHYEFDIDADGKVISSRTFTRACLNLTQAPLAKGQKPVAVFITHLLDTTPTEIHVFLSRWMGLPVVVATPSSLPAAPGPPRMWVVDGDQIRLLKH